MNDKGFGPAALDKSSTNKDAIRGREQQLIDSNGGAKSQHQATQLMVLVLITRKRIDT